MAGAANGRGIGKIQHVRVRRQCAGRELDRACSKPIVCFVISCLFSDRKNHDWSELIKCQSNILSNAIVPIGTQLIILNLHYS